MTDPTPLSVDPILLTVGTFDLFHSGHVDLLRQCRRIVRRFGDVVVGVNTDRFVEEFKHRAPVVPLHERLDVVQACRYVDRVVENDSPDLRPLILRERPHFVAVGSDWAGGTRYFEQTGLSQAWLDANDVVLLFVSRPDHGPSSTRIKAAL